MIYFIYFNFANPELNPEYGLYRSHRTLRIALIINKLNSNELNLNLAKVPV